MRRMLLASIAALLAAWPTFAQDTNMTSRVVLVRNPAAVNGMTVDTLRVHGMVDVGMQTFTGETNAAAAWKHFVSPDDIVGIKVSTIAGALHSTHQAVIDAVADGLREAGVATNHIIVFDRDPQKIAAADYHSKTYVITSIIDGSGWDPAVFMESPLVGKLIWGDLGFGQDDGIGNRSHLPKLVTEKITKLINIPVLMDHEATGLANCLYNISLGMLDNSRRFEQMGRRGDPAIVQMCTLAPLKKKLVLNITDALVAGYAGGPAFKPQYAWPQASLYFGQDPVAVDAICLDLLEAKRQAEHMPKLGERAVHITTAGQVGYGQSDLKKIDLIESTANQSMDQGQKSPANNAR